MDSSRLKMVGAILLTAGFVALVGFQHRQIQSQQVELAALRAEIAAAATPPAPAVLTVAGPSEELLRLRADVAKFRRDQVELARLRAENVQRLKTGSTPTSPPQLTSDDATEREALKAQGIARLNYTKKWGLALLLFAHEHGDVLPETLADAAPYFQVEPGSVELSPDQFELMYRGSLKDIQQPAQTILLREKDPWPNSLQSGRARTYLFADGHSEIKASPDGHFEAWEREHSVPTPP